MRLTGVMHMHSRHSYDGKLELAELKAMLIKQGVQFACMTEHTDTLTPETAAIFVRRCHEFSDESFLFIPGFEVPYNDAHILHIGTSQFVCDVANAEKLREWRSVSQLVILAHPVRNHFKVDAVMTEVIDGVEIWNQQYEGKLMPRPRSMQLLRTMRAGKSLIATGGLDFHRREHFGSPLVSLEVETFTKQSILDTLKSGRFSFGDDTTQVSGTEDWQPTSKQKLISTLSVLVIVCGKAVNAALKKVGITLPSSLKTIIRSRV